jgi:hypothetical protein
MGFLDFFKPQWKHSEASVRAAAIRALEEDQQALLLSLALEDQDAGNRLIAARKVKDAEMLKKLRDRSTDKSIKELAQKAWVESQVAAAKSAEPDPQSIERGRNALEGVGDEQRALEDIAKGAVSLDIRKAAFAKLTHAGAFHAVAMAEEDNGLALKALDKVSRENHLESLAKNAKSKAVRTAAKERLKALTAVKGPDAAAVNRAKLGLVLAAVEKLAVAAQEPPAKYDWETGKVHLDEAEAALEELMAAGVKPEADRLARFREGSSVYRARFARWRHERNEREEKQKQAAENRRLKEDLCVEIENLWNASAEAPVAFEFPAGTEGAETASPAAGAAGTEAVNPQIAKARSMRERFQGIGQAPEGVEEELQKRFRAALEKIERRIRDREVQARKSGEEKEHGGRLASLCEQAEALAQLPIAQAVDRFRELRKEWNKAFAAAGGFAGKEGFRARFENAVASTQASLDQMRAANLARLRELLPRLEALLESPDMAAAEKRVKELSGEWRAAMHPAPVGPEAEHVLAGYQAFLDRFREASEWLRWSNLRAKTSVCERLEALAAQEGEDRKALVARFKELQGEWKSVGPVPWDSSEALWDRYHQVSDKLYERCREYFAELDEERESNLKSKEELCARIEALNAAEDIDWREAMETVKEAQSAWKALGAVPKAQSDAIWTRFRAASNAFFERKDKQNLDNLARKLELVALAESLQDSTEWKSAGTRIKEAQEKWKAVGPVPRDQADAIWERFHGACEKFYSARRAFAEKLESEKPRNLARKEEIIKAMEGLDALKTDQERFDAIKEAQAAWKDIGPAGTREADDALWERFRKPIDAYFETRKARMGEERAVREENAKAKEDICLEAESLIGSTEWKATIEKIKALQERWKATGPAPRESDRELWRRFRAACDAFFDRLKENSAKRDQERGGNLKRKTDLCFLVEAMLSRPLTEDEAKARAAWEAESLPMDIARFKVKPGAPDWNGNTEKVKSIQKEWKKIGPVPRELSDALWERFHSACDAFFEERRQALGLRPEDPQANLERKLELIEEAEALARNPGQDSSRRAAGLQNEWRRVGAVPRAQSDYVWRRFMDACNQAMGRAPREPGHEDREAEPEAETAANP